MKFTAQTPQIPNSFGPSRPLPTQITIPSSRSLRRPGHWTSATELRKSSLRMAVPHSSSYSNSRVLPHKLRTAPESLHHCPRPPRQQVFFFGDAEICDRFLFPFFHNNRQRWRACGRGCRHGHHCRRRSGRRCRMRVAWPRGFHGGTFVPQPLVRTGISFFS